jgi:hypothetical protein
MEEHDFLWLARILMHGNSCFPIVESYIFSQEIFEGLLFTNPKSGFVQKKSKLELGMTNFK